MSDDFDAILDRCLADITAGRETVESCLQNYPTHAERLVALLKTAQQARVAPRPTPLPTDKRRALESRLLRRASQFGSKPAPWPAAPRTQHAPVWRRRVVLAVASFMVVFLLFGSTVSASAASVPGDILYPVKRAAEQARLALTPAQQRADLHLEFARQRLREMQVLTDRGEVSEDLLAEISNETTVVLEQAAALPHEGQRTVLESLTDFQDQHLQVLNRMASSAHGEAQAKVMAALADSAAKRQLVKQLLAGAASDNAPGGSSGNPPASFKEKTKPAHGNPTLKPEATDKPGPRATPRATKESPANPQKPTPKVEHAPPGQTGQLPPQGPPGQADRSASHAPPQKPTKVPAK
jgi:hypothetical protein